MFQITDHFTAYDTNKLPYSFSPEQHVETANFRAGITEEGFSLKAIGNRFLLHSPKFVSGTFEMNFSISYPYETNPCFQIIFGYNKETRTGQALQFVYTIGKSLSVTLVSVQNGTYLPLSDSIQKPWILPEHVSARCVLKIDSDSVCCTVDDLCFSFEVSHQRGYLALDRSAFIGELIIRDFSFVSEEIFPTESILHTPKFEIPLINGGDIPYTIQYSADNIDGEYYITATLDGGTKSRAKNKKERRGQYVAEIDYMTAPYIGLSNAKQELIFQLSNRENCFVDPNIFWDCQKLFFGDTNLPITNQYKIENFVPDSTNELIFGYKNLLCKGYAQQEGGCEFRFSVDGQIVSQGQPLDGADTYKLTSPEEKKAISLIPGDCAEYEAIVRHLKSNHYFSVDENIVFELFYRTEINPDYLRFKAEIKNVFETERICQTDAPQNAVRTYLHNYHEIHATASFAPLPVGVYQIIFTVFYGESEHNIISYAFEVYDETSDLCPPLASGLPFLFTMNNEQKKLARNGFDLSNPMPSCDFGHYIACATTTPVEAERMELWKYLKAFGRSWFAWLTIRTCDDYLSPAHDVTIQHADYLFHTGIDTDCDPLGAYSLYPNRVDHWWGEFFYNYPGVKALLKTFFQEHPEYPVGKKISDQRITGELFQEITDQCGNELMEYINRKNCESVKRHNRELASVNPGVKRSIYGPVPPYYCPTLSYRSLTYFGLPDNEDLPNEYYSGFAVFEDYPFSCSYQTYRGPFAAMTILLHLPGLTLYPELYTGSRGGCIDGAVKYAHAPMGNYVCPPYQNATLAFEYVYNTAYKTKDGFGYWNTYGFHRGVENCDYINEFVKSWHYVVEHKPVRPLRSVAFLADYSGDTEIYRSECNYYNQSEGGQTIVYECARESGIPNGFGIRFDDLETLTENDCDLLVLPSLANADETIISHIRRLYSRGVNLIAVSNISGLEDLFGVEPRRRTELVTKVRYQNKSEYIYNTEADFAYQPVSADVLVTANDNAPAVISNGRTALINTAVFSLGCADHTKSVRAKGAFIVGRTIRKALSDLIVRLSSPVAFGENVGITVFEDEHQNRMLLAIRYTPFDNRTHDVAEAVVTLNMDDVTEITGDLPVKAAKKDGIVREIRFPILPHGFAFIKLK